MDSVEIRDLRWFVSLCETENTRDTAAEWRTGQSAVSRGLARLERELGLPLFDRLGHRLRLNRFGSLYLEHAVRAVRELDAGQQRLDVLGGADVGLVRLGFLHSTGRSLVPRMIRAHQARFPHVRFELVEGHARELYPWLGDGVIDAAVVTAPATGRDLEWWLLHEQQLCLAVPPQHRLASGADVRLEDAAGEAFVAFSHDTDLRGVVDDLLVAAGVSVTIAFETSEMATLRGLVAAGLGLGVMPSPDTREQDDPVYRPLSPRRTRRLGLAYTSVSVQTPSVAAFVEQLRTSPPLLSASG